jgi:peroxiredoxin
MNFRNSLFAFAFLSVSVFTVAAQTTIKGTITGDNVPARIYIFEMFGMYAFKIDSANVKNNKVEFKHKKGFTPGFYRIGETEEKSDLIILSNESFSFEVNAKNFKGITTVGSKENEVFNQYQAFNQSINQKVGSMSSRYQKIVALVESNREEYEKQIKELKGEYDALMAAQNEYYNKLSTENEHLFVGKVARFMKEAPNATKKDFFDVELLTQNPGLLTADLMHNKFNQYIQRFQIQDANTLMAEAQAIIETLPAKSKVREVAYQAFSYVLLQNEAQGVRKFATQAVNEFNSKYSKRLLESIPFVPEVGDKAPDITLPDRSGKMASMSALTKGKVVLLDFWAAWCGPCRHENPNVVKAYHKFKDKGFTVFSVSLDNNKDKWLEAIKKDALEWDTHVSDLKGWQSEGARKYGVTGIPATYLIDKNGVIIAKNLRGAQLEQKLSEILK